MKIFIYKTNLMHKLQTHLKEWCFTTTTCSGTSVPSSGSSYISSGINRFHPSVIIIKYSIQQLNSRFRVVITEAYYNTVYYMMNALHMYHIDFSSWCKIHTKLNNKTKKQIILNVFIICAFSWFYKWILSNMRGVNNCNTSNDKL
jgi:hypothetical protein